MAESVLMFEVGERFGTVTPEGRATVWQVGEDGVPVQVMPPVKDEVPPPPPENVRDKILQARRAQGWA